MGYMGTAARSAIARPYGARRMGVTGIRGKRHAEDRDPILSTDRYTPVTIGASQMKPTVFSTVRTSKMSLSIRDSPPLTEELVGKWVASWKETGFLR